MGRTFQYDKITDEDIKTVAQTLVYRQVNTSRAVAVAKLLAAILLPDVKRQYSVTEVSEIISMEMRRLLVRSLGDPAQLVELEYELQEELAELLNETP